MWDWVKSIEMLKKGGEGGDNKNNLGKTHGLRRNQCHTLFYHEDKRMASQGLERLKIREPLLRRKTQIKRLNLNLKFVPQGT